MQKYNSNAFYKAFLNIGLKKGDVVLVHNALFSFGIPRDVPLKELPAVVYMRLREVIGETGTVAVPTFNFDFCKGIPFDLKTTPSKNMGVFSEFIRTMPNSLRSKHPMQSIAAVGPLADDIVNGNPQSAFGENGAFDVLLKNNAKILLLGADYNAASFVHMVEEQNQVPYRYWKSFTAPYTGNGALNEERTYQMYVRDLDTDPVLNMNWIEDILKTKKILQTAKIGSGFIKCIKASEYVAVADALIKENPYCFVENHKTTAN